jgi:hypothetical protein
VIFSLLRFLNRFNILKIGFLSFFRGFDAILVAFAVYWMRFLGFSLSQCLVSAIGFVSCGVGSCLFGASQKSVERWNIFSSTKGGFLGHSHKIPAYFADVNYVHRQTAASVVANLNSRHLLMLRSQNLSTTGLRDLAGFRTDMLTRTDVNIKLEN